MARKNKLNAQQFKAIREMAVSVSGYDDTSPIWGKRLTEVVDLIEDYINTGDYGDALTTIAELRKRLTKGALLAH